MTPSQTTFLENVKITNVPVRSIVQVIKEPPRTRIGNRLRDYGFVPGRPFRFKGTTSHFFTGKPLYVFVNIKTNMDVILTEREVNTLTFRAITEPQ